MTAQGGKHLSSIFRRLYRIFAHAWFQHREVFWEVEGEWGLYLFFKTVSERYNLIPEDNLTIPPEAEGGAEDGVDEFSRGGESKGDEESSAEEGQGGNEKKEDNDEDDEDDYGSDDSDESDEHSGSGSSSDGGEGAEGDAFDLELPMEGTEEVKNENVGVGEELVNGEMLVEDSKKREDETTESSEEGEEIPLVIEQEDVESASRERSKSPSPPPAVHTPPPGSPSPPPGEETGERKEEKDTEKMNEEEGKPEPVPVGVEAEVVGEEGQKEQKDQIDTGKEEESGDVKEKEEEGEEEEGEEEEGRNKSGGSASKANRKGKVPIPLKETGPFSDEGAGVGGYEMYMAGDDDEDSEDEEDEKYQKFGGKKDRKSDPAIYKSAANGEDGGVAFTMGAVWNRLSVVLRDGGLLKFVKYISQAAEGDRWDIIGGWGTVNEGDGGGDDGEEDGGEQEDGSEEGGVSDDGDDGEEWNGIQN